MVYVDKTARALVVLDGWRQSQLNGAEPNSARIDRNTTLGLGFRLISFHSSRRVDDLIKALGCDGISSSQVSRICEQLDEVVESFLGRPLDGGPTPTCGWTA